MEVKELWLLQKRPNPMILIISCPHTFPTFPHVVPSLSYMTTAAPTLTHHTLTPSAPVHSLRMPPKRSSDRKKKEKKTEKEGKGRLWWPQREGVEAPRQAQSHCMRQARREKPFLWRTHARDILVGGLGVVLIFVSGKTITELTA